MSPGSYQGVTEVQPKTSLQVQSYYPPRFAEVTLGVHRDHESQGMRPETCSISVVVRQHHTLFHCLKLISHCEVLFGLTPLALSLPHLQK
jgi:hypothetical protein